MIIQSERVWVAGAFMPAAIEMKDHKIVRVYKHGSVKVDKDYGDMRILPGFIDIHCHGAFGFDTNDANPEGLKHWTKNIPSEGVTSFLATTITQLKSVLKPAVENVAKVMDEGYDGAEILGIHFEGPYLDMKYKGAQPPEAIVKPNVEEFKEYQEAAKGHIKLMTVAPEHDDDFALTRYCAEHNVAISIGHTSATYEEATLAVANGAKSFTHTFNGMSPFNHRANGTVGASMRLDGVFGEVICDGHHSTPEALHMFFKNKGKDHVIMISDALMCKGSPVGSKFMFGGHEIEIMPDGTAHLTESGTIAGSTLKLNNGLRNLVEKAQVSFAAAINACTINPAKLIGVADRKGRIMTGYDADIVVIDDAYDVVDTYCRGKLAYSK